MTAVPSEYFIEPVRVRTLCGPNSETSIPSSRDESQPLELETHVVPLRAALATTESFSAA